MVERGQRLRLRRPFPLIAPSALKLRRTAGTFFGPIFGAVGHREFSLVQILGRSGASPPYGVVKRYPECF